jgi:VanZ family protein
MADSRLRLIGLLGATAAAALALASLLPTSWVPRTGLGWEDEHFIVYFITTLILSLASRRPCVVAAALMICAGVLEAAQGLTPDRIPDLTAALSGAAGVMFAAFLVVVLMRLVMAGYLASCREWLRRPAAQKWTLRLTG